MPNAPYLFSIYGRVRRGGGWVKWGGVGGLTNMAEWQRPLVLPETTNGASCEVWKMLASFVWAPCDKGSGQFITCHPWSVTPKLVLNNLRIGIAPRLSWAPFFLPEYRASSWRLQQGMCDAFLTSSEGIWLWREANRACAFITYSVVSWAYRKSCSHIPVECRAKFPPLKRQK